MISKSSVHEISTNDTLEDGAWKDSFDKIIEQPRNVLRSKNILKKRVRASFNLDSSFENSRESAQKSKICNVEVPLIQQMYKAQHDKLRQPSLVSTPKHLFSSAIKCSISPIGMWENCASQKDQQIFHATPINLENIVIEFNANEEKSLSYKESPDKSPGALLRECFGNKKEKRPARRQVLFENISNAETTQTKKNEPIKKMRAQSLALKPGKWRKSMNILRRTYQNDNANRRVSNLCHSIIYENDTVEYHGTTAVVGQRKSVFIGPECNANETSFELSPFGGEDWKTRVLNRCRQREPLLFNKLYNFDKIKNCRKIGEGAYGEVFLNSTGDKNTTETVLKIIPIEGDIEINGEKQKTFQQILPEIIISMELCNLRNEKLNENATAGFVAIKKISCVQGKYPKHFLKLWQDYDECKGSENDNPVVFSNTQLYIVLELDFCGQDLESFVFSNAEQAFYALQQIVLTLAVGEEIFQFEHRDLHWGNILILNTNQSHITYKLNNRKLTVPSKGIKVTIIDYTLSRMTYNNCYFYNDLSCDEELFSATGDYQFEIYRMMRNVLENNWENYEPKTNVFWISYIVTKLIDGVSYKNTRSKTHANYLTKLKHFKENVLSNESAANCVKYFKK